MKRKTVTTPKRKPSITNTAAKLSLSRSTLYQWKAEGCPVDQGEEAILKWAMDNARGGTEPDALRSARLEVLTQTARRLKLANDERDRLTVNRDEVVYAIGKGMSAMARILDRKFKVELPPDLTGRDPAYICLKLVASLDEVYDAMRGEFSKLDKVETGGAE